MGLYDRDYYRDEPRRWWGSSHEKRAVWCLIVLTAMGMIAYHIFPNAEAGRAEFSRTVSLLDEYAPFHQPSVLRGEVWRFVSSFFVVPFSLFLVFGLFGLYIFGGEMESIYGTWRFLLFYIAAGVLGNLGKFGLAFAGQGSDYHTLGNSGPIFAVFVLFACHFPSRPISLFIVTVPVAVIVAVYLGLDLLSFFGQPGGRVRAVDPLVGALFGFVFYKSRGAMLDVGGWFNAARRERNRPRLATLATVEREGPTQPNAAGDSSAEHEPVKPQRETLDEHLEAKLDDLLVKVAKYGRASLTAEEQALLMRASELFKKRRRG